MDFIIRLPFYKNFNKNDFDNIFIVIYYYLKIAKYLFYYKTINIFELINLLYNKVFHNFGTFNSIISDYNNIFTLKF